MSLHSFDPHIADRVGIAAAVIYKNIVLWTESSTANGEDIHDGRVWVYNSVKAWGDLFPYLTEHQIRTALKKLVEADLVVTGNYNRNPYDRTKWYALS